MDERPRNAPPRNLKAMLSEAKDTSELMVDLGYASLFFADARMADEVHELEERLTELVHEMREVCVLAARSKRDAEQMSSVLHVVSAIERMGNAAVGIARVVTHHLGIPASLVADLAGAEEVSHREDRLDEMREQLELWVLRAGAETVDPSGLRGLLHLGAASEEVGDAAQQLVWLVEQEEEMHPILAVALGEADEVFVQYPIA